MEDRLKKDEEQSEIAGADMLRQKELMEQQEVQMQKQEERIQKNDSSMNIQSKKMQQDFMRREEEFKKKQIELQKKVEQLELQQKKLELMRKDTLRLSSNIYTKPVITVRPAITVKPTVSATSTVNVEPEAIASTATTVNSRLSAMSVISTDSKVNVEPVTFTAITSNLPADGTVSFTRNGTSDDIVNDLEKANVISSRDHLSVQLTNDELIVNGVKQPEEIHRQILKKHMRRPGDKITLLYNNK